MSDFTDLVNNHLSALRLDANLTELESTVTELSESINNMYDIVSIKNNEKSSSSSSSSSSMNEDETYDSTAVPKFDTTNTKLNVLSNGRTDKYLFYIQINTPYTLYTLDNILDYIYIDCTTNNEVTDWVFYGDESFTKYESMSFTILPQHIESGNNSYSIVMYSDDCTTATIKLYDVIGCSNTSDTYEFDSTLYSTATPVAEIEITIPKIIPDENNNYIETNIVDG